MADTHSTLRDNSVRLKKNVSKLAFRSKEKVMRTISRTEETKDEIVDHYYMLINKQQLQMQKLQREMKQYLLAIKAMSAAHKSFFTSLYDVYDDDWTGKDVIQSFSQRIGLLHDDLYARFHLEVTEVLQKHLNEYHEYKFRVEKRGRKLVDYDAARRNLLSLQSAKKPDHVKIDKAEEQVQLARATYEDLNNQLHEQLPALHDSRLPLTVNTFSSICQSERDFYTEIAEMRSKLNNSLLTLKAAFDSGEYHIQRMQPPIDNGRVPPVSSAKSSPPREAKTSPTVRSPASQVDASQHTNATSPAGSPSSDTSNHEYVNLQVGTMPDVVQPVSEEEEITQSKGHSGGSRDRKYSGQKSDGKENGQSNMEEGYILASDPVLPRNPKPVRMVHPKPSPRSYVFRHPSDTREQRPVPKPLPRTFSSPLGKRPLHLSPRSTSPSSRNYRTKGYADFNLCSSNNETGKQPVASLQRRREDIVGRPASMYVQASSELLPQPDLKAKTKDDGSGQADPPKHKKAAMLGADIRKEKGDQVGKKQRSVLGFMSFKKGSKKSLIKTKAKAPAAVELNPPPPPPVRKDAQSDGENPASKVEPVSAVEQSENKSMNEGEFKMVKTSVEKSTAVQATVVQEIKTTEHDGSDATEMSNVSTKQQTNVELREESNPTYIPSDEFRLNRMNSDSEQDIDDAFAKYANKHDEQKSGEEKKAMEYRDFNVDDEQRSDVTHEIPITVHKRNEDDLVETISDSELDTGIQEKEMGVLKFPEQDQSFSVDATTLDESIDPGFVEVTFVGSVEEGVPSTINDAFPLPASDRDSSLPSTGDSFDKDLFGSKPFGTVLNKNDESFLTENVDECRFEEIRETFVSNFANINKETDVNKVSGEAQIQQKVNSGSESDDEHSEGELKQSMTEISALQESEHMHMQILNHSPAITDKSLAVGSDDIATIQDQSKEMSTELGSTGMQNTEIAVGTYSDFAVEGKTVAEVSVPNYQPNSFAQANEAGDTYEDIDQDLKNTMRKDSEAEMSDNLYEDIDEEESSVVQLGKPEPQSPTPKTKLSDNAVIQPIYEEPPREEDLPSYSKPSTVPELPPITKSPTKSDNSVDSHRYLDLPPNYLYSVQAMYQYRSADDDELSFEKGEVIHIIKHPDPEEQDDGWQMGIRQKDWEEKADFESSMGVFPENFSKRIQL